jgi:NAD(P)-dependent dehydrogenase (short-subunit alcohol dehydrogenase family)
MADAQPEKAAYSVTKHAALALSEWLAVQYRWLGIKVSCFWPGPMLTRMLLSKRSRRSRWPMSWWRGSPPNGS